jgi:hypothetical protein
MCHLIGKLYCVKLCDGCELDFEDLIRNVGKSDEKAIEIFERHNIIPVTLDCPKCFCCSTLPRTLSLR